MILFVCLSVCLFVCLFVCFNLIFCLFVLTWYEFWELSVLSLTGEPALRADVGQHKLLLPLTLQCQQCHFNVISLTLKCNFIIISLTFQCHFIIISLTYQCHFNVILMPKNEGQHLIRGMSNQPRRTRPCRDYLFAPALFSLLLLLSVFLTNDDDGVTYGRLW